MTLPALGCQVLGEGAVEPGQARASVGRVTLVASGGFGERIALGEDGAPETTELVDLVARAGGAPQVPLLATSVREMRQA